MVDDKINPKPLQPEVITPQPIPAAQKTTSQASGQNLSGSASTSQKSGSATPLPALAPEPHSDHTIRYIIVIGAVVFFVVIFGLILTFFLNKSGKNDSITLNYWGVYEEKEVIQPLIEDYQRKNPRITIKYTKMVPDDYREKVIARSKNNTGPDIFRFHNTWIPQMREVIAPMPSQIMSTDEFKKTFYPIHNLDLVIGDKVHGIPLSVDGLVLMYNEGLFKKAGISGAPVSWEDILDDVSKLTVKNQEGQVVTSGIALGTANNIDHFSDILGLFFIENGADITQLDQPEAASALESYRRFAEPDTATWDESMPSSIQAFAQEKVAMIIAPSWEALVIKSINPDLEMKVVPVPIIPSSKPLSVASYWVEGVSRYSKNQIEAWKFLKFLSEKESESKLFELQSKVRLFGNAYSRQDLGESLANHEYLGAVINQAKNNAFRSLPVIARTYDKGLNDSIVQYLQNAVNETAQGVSYDQALITAQKGVVQVLTNFQILPSGTK